MTGGGSGISHGAVEAFAIASASAIAILGRKEQALLDNTRAIESKYKSTFSINIADVTDATAVNRTASKIGIWDVLIINAGMSTPGPSMRSNVSEW